MRFLTKSQAALAGTGTNLIGGLILFSLLGNFLDRKSGREGHFWTLCGFFLGIAYMVYEIWKFIRVQNREKK